MEKSKHLEKYLEQAASLADTDRQAYAELITEFIEPNHITTDYISMLLNSRSLQPGDALVKKIRKGIEVHTLVPGSVHWAHEITLSERMNYVLDGADVKVTYNEWELEAGHIGTLESIRTEMYAKLRDYYLTKVFTALTNVWTAVNTPDNFVSVGGTVTASALETAIDQINNTTAGVKAVVGVRSSMTPITKFGSFWNDDGSQWAGVPSHLEEAMSKGFLGRYYGAPLVALDQVWDNLEDYNALLPTDKILVIGENVGEFITFGEVKTKQWSNMDPTPPQWMYEIYQQFGIIIDNAMGIYVIGGLS
jgi:hypothetical protein